MTNKLVLVINAFNKKLSVTTIGYKKVFFNLCRKDTKISP